MNFNLRQLKVFVAVFEMRSFSAAARSVHMTQSAVSKLCQDLEEQVGFALLERSTRHVTPTDAGTALYGFACEILGTFEAAKRSMAGILSLEQGVVRIAASPMMIHDLLTPAITRFRHDHPRVKFELHELSSLDAVNQIIEGKVDFGLVSLDEHYPKLVIEAIHNDRIYAIVDASHVLAARSALSWQDVGGQEHIRLSPTYSLRRTLDRILEDENVMIDSSIEAGTVISCFAMVGAGLGITLLPGYVTTVARQLGLICVPIEGTHAIHQISLVRRANARPSVAARAFIATLCADMTFSAHATHASHD